MAKFHFILLTLALALAPNTSAQDNTAEKPLQEHIIIDEIITQGQRQGSNHPGMNAFFDGDFTTAEIAFEREFLKLKRRRTAIENAAFEASNGQFRAESLAATTGTSSSSAANDVGSRSSTQPNNSFTPNTTSGVTNKGKTGRGVLTDGKVTDDDFSFSKYMAGLSELQLGKFDEAEKSFKTAIFYNSKNYDARLRLGLLHLRNTNFKDAAKQLEKIDKMRRKCIKISCEDKKYITDAAAELANVLTATANHQ